MNKYITIIFITILLAIISNLCSQNYEYFSNKNTIILMGDSIFNNKNYTKKNNSILELLKKKHTKTIIVAEDGGKIEDIPFQMFKISKKINNKDNHLYISVGGNDIIHNYFRPETEYVDDIFYMYKSKIITLLKTIKCKIFLLDIYFPTDKKYHIYYPAIKKWNKLQKIFAKKNDLVILKISDKITKSIHFTHSIEPSLDGGKIITSNIYDNSMTY